MKPHKGWAIGDLDHLVLLGWGGWVGHVARDLGASQRSGRGGDAAGRVETDDFRTFNGVVSAVSRSRPITALVAGTSDGHPADGGDLYPGAGPSTTSTGMVMAWQTTGPGGIPSPTRVARSST